MLSSSLYDTLKSTAESFVLASCFKAPAQGPDEQAIRDLCSNTYSQSWGHDYFISSRPHLNQTLDFDGFMAHLKSMTSKLESAEAKITDLTIDEKQRKVVVRATYRLRPKGCDETASNDLVWILRLTEDGKKVTSGKEFIDGEAAMRLAQLMRAASTTT
ncbi:uncharacterized protein PV09_08384 [Verruconis gallopava]|uniref:SnoaL-like domain-containing protein n=1 Tax=Verruconis gallopava TaxID=253628 RepID=A0A0D1YGX2_9PEZI|nr:uncharacterized protein PV09_08384 [Verruconis gallopava]KIW00032.1 hypothetical protein PV09_08384 [Verruconis gallopava]